MKSWTVVPKTAFIRFHLDPLIETFKLQSGKILLKHKDGLMIHFLSSYKNIEIEKTMVFKNNFHDENLLIIHSPGVAWQYHEEFVRVWEAAEGS